MFSAQWTALTREAAIAGQSISGGLTALRKANYVATGLYSHAFFSLSIGIERLLKLIFLIDYAIKNNGTFPSHVDFKRRFGHDLMKLYEYARMVHDEMPNKSRRYEVAAGGIEEKILSFLSDFAISTRYYNLDFLSGSASARSSLDPISYWFSVIGSEIFQRHYNGRERDAHAASVLQHFLGDFTHVQHTSEDGMPLTDVETASLQTGKNKVLQKYGTHYCVRAVRFLYMILWDINHHAHKHGLQIPYLYELFFPFLNDDSYLLTRKTFPPRGQ